MRRRPLTRAAAIASATLLASGGALLASSAAVAAPVSAGEFISSVAPDADPYVGWHEGYANTTPGYEVRYDGLAMGINGQRSQVINGLDTPTVVTGDELGALISNASVTVARGAATYQVPLFFGPETAEPRGFTTLRPAEAAVVGESAYTTDQLWVSSRVLPAVGETLEIAANTPAPLSAILDTLDAQDVAVDDIEVLAYGVQVEAGVDALITSIVWDGYQATFTTIPSFPLAVTPATVRQSEIQPNPLENADEVDISTLSGWYQNSSQLLAAIGADGVVALPGSQLPDLSGLIYVYPAPQPGAGSVLGQALRDLSVGVEQGELEFLIVGSFGDLGSGSMLVSRDLPFGVDSAPISLDEEWTFTLGTQGGTLPLGELVELLNELDGVTINAFGVLNSSVEPAALGSITFNGVAYTFAQAAVVTPGVTPAGVTGPQLAATGSEATGVALGAGLLAAGALLLMARGSRRVRAQG